MRVQRTMASAVVHGHIKMIHFWILHIVRSVYKRYFVNICDDLRFVYVLWTETLQVCLCFFRVISQNLVEISMLRF